MGGFRGTPRMPRLGVLRGPRFDAAVRARASAYTLIETAKLNDIDPHGIAGRPARLLRANDARRDDHGREDQAPEGRHAADGPHQRRARAHGRQDRRRVAVSAFMQDITDHKRAEEDLRANEKRLRLVSEAANIDVHDLDVAAGLANSSSGLCRLTGTELDGATEAQGGKPRKAIRPDLNSAAP